MPTGLLLASSGETGKDKARKREHWIYTNFKKEENKVCLLPLASCLLLPSRGETLKGK